MKMMINDFIKEYLISTKEIVVIFQIAQPIEFFLDFSIVLQKVWPSETILQSLRCTTTSNRRLLRTY